MKKTLAILSLFFLVFTCPVFPDQTVDEYVSKKIQESYKNIKKNGNFALLCLPGTLEFGIAGNYNTWQEKRFDNKRILQEIDTLKNETNNNIYIVIQVSFIGDATGDEIKSLKIPKDIQDYIFLENNNGLFIRCSKAEISGYNYTVNQFTDHIQIALKFPTIHPETNESIFNDTETIKVIVGGLGFEDHTFEYKLPLSDYYLDAPDVLKKLYYESGIWERENESQVIVDSNPDPQPAEKKTERDYQEQWAREHGAKIEVQLRDGTRVDCLTDTHAIEVDFARKWTEAIGQSMHYSRMTGKRAGIVLIITDPDDMKYWDRLKKLIEHSGLPIDTWKLEDY
ncbi:hypothetical protein J7L67_02055 [bacterium]|nr:hypothetical protein [bacterium]